MRLDEMKYHIPETPDFIHTLVQSEVEKQLNTADNIVQMKRPKKKVWTLSKVAAIVIVCVTAVSTAAYAGVRIYHMYIERQGKYSIATGIETDGDSQEYLPETLHDIRILTDYIPNGMEWQDEDHLTFAETPYQGGFSFSAVVMDENNVDELMVDTGVVESEKRKFGKYEGVYLKYQDTVNSGSFTQRIYLLCPEEFRVIMVYIGDDVSKDDAIKVAENIKITELDTTFETQGAYTWADVISNEKNVEESAEDEPLTEIKDDKVKIYDVGTQITFPERQEGEQVSVCVDSIQIADDLSLLSEKDCPNEWKDAVGADGKFVENHLSYIKSGDGINTLDEVVKTESVRQKLIYATVTYTNHSDVEIKDMLYYGSIMLLHHENGSYQIYMTDTGDISKGYDRITGDSIAGMQEMAYCSTTCDTENGNNYIASIKPGESVTVNMAWILNEPDLKNMYLNLCTDSMPYGFSQSILDMGIVDIREQ